MQVSFDSHGNVSRFRGFYGFGDASTGPYIPPGMPDAPAAVLSRLIAAYVQGSISANLAPVQFESDMFNLASLGAIPDTWFTLAIGDASQAAAIANLKTDGNYIIQLATSLAAQAWDGQRSDGSPYTWDDWTAFANNVGSDIATQTQGSWDGDWVVGTMGAAKQTLTDLSNTVKNPLGQNSLLPGWVLPIALLFGAAYAYNTFAAPVSGAYRAGRDAYKAARKLSGGKKKRGFPFVYLIPIGLAVFAFGSSKQVDASATPPPPPEVPPGIQPPGYNPKTDPTSPYYDPMAV